MKFFSLKSNSGVKSAFNGSRISSETIGIVFEFGLHFEEKHRYLQHF